MGPRNRLLGGARKEHITPYASLLPTGRTGKDYRESLVAKARHAKQLGFRAGKMEVCVKGPYSHNGLQEDDALIVEIVAACREAVGPDFVMMVDVCYCWNNAKEALRVMRQLEPYDLFFLETPIDIDDLEGHAYLHENSSVRIAAGEWQNTHFEFEDLADRGKIHVLQPDLGRVGQVVHIDVVHGRDRDGSDLDLLVDAPRGTTLLDMVRIQHAIEAQIGLPVDVLTAADLPPRFRDQVLLEAQPL